MRLSWKRHTSYRRKQRFSRAFLLTSINQVKFIPLHWHIELLTLTRPGSLCCFTYRKRAWLAQLSEGPVSNHRVLRAQNCTFSAAVCTLGQGKSDAYTGKGKIPDALCNILTSFTSRIEAASNLVACFALSLKRSLSLLGVDMVQSSPRCSNPLQDPERKNYSLITNGLSSQGTAFLLGFALALALTL